MRICAFGAWVVEYLICVGSVDGLMVLVRPHE